MFIQLKMRFKHTIRCASTIDIVGIKDHGLILKAYKTLWEDIVQRYNHKDCVGLIISYKLVDKGIKSKIESPIYKNWEIFLKLIRFLHFT